MKVAFLTTGHCPFDDRIFFHFARALSDEGNNVAIISSKTDLSISVEGINLDCFDGHSLPKKEKISSLSEKLSLFEPEVVICSEPLAVAAARKYSRIQEKKVSIIYDITEWYPSKKNLLPYRAPVKYIMFLKFLFFNLFASFLADAFIFGEWYKSRPFRLIFPFKPFSYITYYPDLEYTGEILPELNENSLRLCYSGPVSIEKGYANFINVIMLLARIKRDLVIDLKIIGWYNNRHDREECEFLATRLPQNVNVSLFDRQPFRDFMVLIADRDLFIDLRSDDFENQHCLPIKLFYYAALGRPVIFSSLKSIKKEVDIGRFGYLVDPAGTEQIARIISGYLDDHDLYYSHCRNARKIAEEKYNWNAIKQNFTDFVRKIKGE
jgi:glycosyltransferase involved in cell wall biosynthesis